MDAVSRRAVLRSASVAVGAAAFGGLWARAASPAAASAGNPHRDVAADARMVWKRLPGNWQEGPFLANGYLGAQVYAGKTPDTLKVMLSHTQVQDQRIQWEAGIGLSRLPIGYLTLTFAGAITAVDWTLDLYNAELGGTITTTRGSVAFSAVVHNDLGVLLVSLTPGDGEKSAAWAFQPLESATTRTVRKPPEYVANPAPEVAAGYCAQPMLAGGGYTTAWRERAIGTRRLFAATVAYSFPGTTHTADARGSVEKALAANPDALLARHRRWWNDYHRRSFVSVPDKQVQRFYWIQLYKIAAATRADGPVVSEWGPWFPEVGNSWTAVWWNLNVQVTYPIVNSSNHPELDAVTETFRRDHANLETSVPPAYRDGDTYALSHPGDWRLRPGGTRSVGVPGTTSKTDQTGNLLWGLHNVWLAYRHHLDRQVLRDVLYPTLAKALNFYRHFLFAGPDGSLHLPLTRSPEYADAPDCTYDLSLIRWAARTLVDTARILRLDEPRVPIWREIGAKLVPYHEDPANGVLIGDGVPLAASHRHFSHLLWLYPLREKVWDRPADRDVMTRTFDHWAADQSAWHGYSYAAASSMKSVMDAPQEALRYLKFFLDRNVVADTELTANTMYREGSNFAIESPITAAQSIVDMLMQGSGGVLKIFPSVSATWRDASIAGLRAEGAFLVDASRRDGRTEFVRVHSEAGEPLVLQHGIAGDVDVRDEYGRRLPCRPAGTGRIAVGLCRGGTAVVTPRGGRPDCAPRDVPALGPAPQWGLPS
ncbi:glycosyl hydrolase family 95 catalytic domain-containing protein [Amycolatopsis sp. NPDC101161]|uniref:glycosyl hydrolase family 95 catalytic domain-containing protein n=1 Tax=Amycolatopsis sp. NPDC101161 TaxID=3363940 RepID=UPI00381A3F56